MIYDLLRQHREQAAALCLGGLPAAWFVFSWEDNSCSKCGGALLVRLTRSRKVISARYGNFVAVERQGYCPKHRHLPPARSERLLRIVAPRSKFAYDVLVQIGFARFLQCRQAEEIQIELSRQHGIEVPLRTIRELSQKFVTYVQIVHQESLQLLRAAMQQRGGYILHVDGTCEEGSGVLLVCLDSLSEQVLESRRIGSENHQEVTQVLQDVRRNWGIPLAIVHDLRQSLITATAEVFPAKKQFVCHYHFAADVGKDILSAHVDRLRRLFRRTRVRPKLRALCRSLKDYVRHEAGEPLLGQILAVTSTKKLRQLSTPEAIKGTVHALSSWILAFSHSGGGYGFPFDLPYLTLYDRILTVHDILCEIDENWAVKKRGPFGALRRLKDILEIVVTSEYTAEFRSIVAETRRDRVIFDRLRNALRICPKGGTKRRNDDGSSSMLSCKRHKALLEKLRASLKRKARRSNSQACNIVVKHLDKYFHLLFGHVVRKGTRKIVVPRTNNVEESLFRTVKRQCRRLHGRGHLSRDMDDMSEATPLLFNLRNTSYCKTVYGGTEPERVAERFSLVDPTRPGQLLKGWRQEKLSVRLPRKFERLPNLPQRLARFIRVAYDTIRNRRIT